MAYFLENIRVSARGSASSPKTEVQHMIEDWASDDYEKSLEEYPGIIGYEWDGEFFLVGSCLAELEKFGWRDFDDWLDSSGQQLRVHLKLSTGPRDIVVEAYEGRAQALDQIGTIDVFRDTGPPDNPVSGSGYLFFIPDGVTAETISGDVGLVLAAFRKAMEA